MAYMMGVSFSSYAYDFVIMAIIFQPCHLGKGIDSLPDWMKL